jgi:hypothetical protein
MEEFMQSQIQENAQEIDTDVPTILLPAKASELQLVINVACCCTDTDIAAMEVTWPEVCAFLTDKPAHHGSLNMQEYLKAESEVKKREKDHAAWLPASFKSQEVGRKQENIDKVYFVALDCDGGVDFADAIVKLKGYEAVIHTTYSHTSSLPKFRAVLPLSHPIEPDQVKPLFDYMQAKFDNKLDPACMEPARLFYLPACPPDAVGAFQSIHLTGRLLDLEEVLAEDRALPERVTDAPVATGEPAIKLATVHGVPVGSRNTELARLVGLLVSKGFDVDKTTDLSLRWNNKLPTPLSEHEVKRTVLSVYKTAERKAKLSLVELDKVVTGMNESYAFLNESSRIVRLSDRSVQSKEMMRDRYSNAVVVALGGDRTRRVTHFQAWAESPNRREHIGFTFQPGQGLIVDNHINQWTEWGASPVAGNIEPWNEMQDYLFGAGTPERKWIEQWIAYPLQYPGTKLSTAVVIWSSRQGVGKSLLGDTISRLYARHAKTITATELHDKNNSWAEDALFVLGEENSGSDHRADSNRLKHLITGSEMFVHEKYQVGRLVPNLLNFMFTSNHPDAFHLEIHDRRYFVWSIDAPPKAPEFYKDFANWRDSPAGLSALMHHMLNVDLTGFDPFGHAPVTKAKAAMVEQSKTETERWVTDALRDDYIDHHIGAEVVSLNELVIRFHREVSNGKTNTTALGKALRRQCAYEQRRVSVGKDRINVLTLRNHELWHGQDSSVWAAEYAKGKKVSLGMSLS